MMKFSETLIAGSMLIATAISGASHARSQQQTVNNIVLVHGAFADCTN